MDREVRYDNLPDHILVDIMLYLNLRDRCNASLTCKPWNNCFKLGNLWRRFVFTFIEESHSRFLKLFSLHGQHLQNVRIDVDQSQEHNRDNACTAIREFVKLDKCRMSKFRIRFIGKNPYFYAGKEFISSLSSLFSHTPVQEILQHLDLSWLNVTFEESFLNIIAEEFHALKSLNILNNVLVCKIGPKCVNQIVQNCRKLTFLAVHHRSLNDDTLLAFTEDDRAPLDTLVFKCRREEKYGKQFKASTWQKVTKKLPKLQVTLIFDYTCPLHKLPEIMTPEVPVTVLRLETFTYIYDEVRLAAQMYSKTLRKLVLNTPLSRNAPELNKALVELATECKQLSTLHVFCVLEKETVEKILALHPEMKEKETYTLRYTDSQAPWIPEKDCGEDE